MLKTLEEKRSHPQYHEYLEDFLLTLGSLEGTLRGSGDPGIISDRCLSALLTFYDCDSAALVETNLEYGYGVCVSERCREGVTSYEGRIIDVSLQNMPYLYNMAIRHQEFDIEDPESIKDKAPQEYAMLKKMGVKILAVAPYTKRTIGFLYIRNPRRYVGLYDMLQMLSYVCASERNEFKLMDILNLSLDSENCHSDNDVIIRFFGGLTVTTNFGKVLENEFHSNLSVKMLAYLLENRDRRVTKTELVDALWPNSDVDNKQVRNVVYHIRKVLSGIYPGDLVISDNMGNYYLDPNVHIMTDTNSFSSHYRLGKAGTASQKEKIYHLKEAIKLYSHDYLPALYGDMWLDNIRTRYRINYFSAVEELLPILYAEGIYAELYSISSAALLIEPERGHILYWHIRAMISLGAIDMARQYYVVHSQELEEDEKKYLLALFSSSRMTQD